MQESLHGIRAVDTPCLMQILRNRLNGGIKIDDIHAHPAPQRQKNKDKVARPGKLQPHLGLHAQNADEAIRQRGFQTAKGKTEHNTGDDDRRQRRNKIEGLEEIRERRMPGSQHGGKEQRHGNQNGHVPHGKPCRGLQRHDVVLVQELSVVAQADELRRSGTVNPLEAHDDRGNRGIQINAEQINDKGRNHDIGHNARIIETGYPCSGTLLPECWLHLAPSFLMNHGSSSILGMRLTAEQKEGEGKNSPFSLFDHPRSNLIDEDRITRSSGGALQRSPERRSPGPDAG